jgi:hypothetical protein
MEVGKALRKVMLMWEITAYQLSQASGVHNTVIGKILNNKAKGVTWITVDRLASGLEKIDPIARVAFLGALALPDDGINEVYAVIKAEKKEARKVTRVIEALRHHNLLNEHSIQFLEESLKKSGMSFEQFILSQAMSMFPKEISEAYDIRPCADDL